MLLRKCFGGISLVMSIIGLMICTWLLIAALTDPQCKHFDPDDPEYTRGSHLIEQKRKKFSSASDRYLRGRNPDFTVWENIEEYCVYAVENWTTGAGIGIAMAILQLITSSYLLATDFGENPLNRGSWVVLWCIGHFVFAGGYGGALYAGLLGEVNKEHHQVMRIGKIFCVATGVIAGLCILLSALSCFWIRRAKKASAGHPSSVQMQQIEFIPKGRVK